jgi:hypothetical protein
METTVSSALSFGDGIERLSVSEVQAIQIERLQLGTGPVRVRVDSVYGSEHGAHGFTVTFDASRGDRLLEAIVKICIPTVVTPDELRVEVELKNPFQRLDDHAATA